MELTKLARAQCPVLLTGPSGVGKSHWAQAIHHSHRPRRPFIEVDTAALHDTTFDSQLFGHRRGSFTGAVGDQEGLCKATRDGTLFLDEIGDLDLSLQKKLLMLIERRSFLPIGASVRVPFRGHLILATNRDLGQLVQCKQFREDLYYRIRVVEMAVKPLRERREELSAIMAQLLGQLQERYQGLQLSLSRELEAYLLHHSWPGNIREFKNVLEYLLIFAEGEAQLSDLPPWMMQRGRGGQRVAVRSFQRAMEDFERQYFTQVLEANAGRINQTSREIGVSKTTLITKAKKYNIDTHVLRARTVL